MVSKRLITRGLLLSFSTLLCGGVLVLLRVPPATAQESASPAEELFARDVLPLFKSKCFACHGDDPQDIRGEFNMLSRKGLLRGGESEEPAVVPGKPEQSSLYLAVKWEGLEMPPKENDRLDAAEIRTIKDWIAGGAPWPSEKRIAELRRLPRDGWNNADGIAVQTSGGLSEEWTNRKYERNHLWAYQPLWKDTAESLKDGNRNPVDVLIDSRLQKLGLQPAPAADRRTLIRRATFDLIGLPPTPEEIEAFVGDSAADDEAFAKVVDRLLQSPHYGEQWGRHWLDVVRYADSSGYANDYERGNAWRYRDYVVRAFNDDKPYDQFVREQIAGDEMDASDPELLIAAGFLRMGPWELTGMEVAKVARQRFLDDVTDAVGQVFLAHMLQCARCHDHKFDPVPTRDYYSIQAAFATTQLAERQAAFLPDENTDGFEEHLYLQQRLEYYRKTLRELDKKRSIEAARAWFAQNGLDASEFERVIVELGKQPSRKSQEITLGDVRRQLAKRKVSPDLIPPRHVGFTPRDFGLERIARKGIERLKWRLERYEPIAFSVYSGPTPVLKTVNAPRRVPQNRVSAGEIESTCILIGGDPFSLGDTVAPGRLSVVEQMKDGADRINAESRQGHRPGDPISGRRRALADWIASEDNPLTARVMVNRIWQWHFGLAIAGNPNNFGTTGKKPSHPRLLDLLAGEFIKAGWSVKTMHRLIMKSAAYRRASRHPDPQSVADKDPDDTSYAVFRPRRLDAEELRDAMLFVSGELNPAIGGIPVRPEMNLEAALQPRQVMGTFAEAWQPSPHPEQRHRRSLYALRIRGQRDPFLEVFNAPNSDVSCEAREASTVTPQVFALFNSEKTFDRALALANRVLTENSKDEGDHTDKRESATPNHRMSTSLSPFVIARLFRITYGRSPNAGETEACLDHWSRMTKRHKALRFDLPFYPKEVVREAVEENTGEKFTFVEPLEFYADFVPDLKPSDVGPEVRGLAEVCLVLLNANEFAYIY